jgi:hypothetical protein
MSRKLYSILSLFLLAAILLTACGGAATEPPDWRVPLDEYARRLNLVRARMESELSEAHYARKLQFALEQALDDVRAPR